jgi:murein DD-endopeptidase MepM/ murein hydrolase activator NlpD
MKNQIIILALIIAIFAGIVIYNLYSINTIQQTVVTQANLPQIIKKIQNQVVPQETSQVAPEPVKIFEPPISRSGERVTKKNFGQYITPKTSPVQPEKFSGYHTGTDFEIFPEELNADVPINAICDGKIVLKKYASGYGGLLVESCSLDNDPITIVYGHLKLASIQKKIGDSLSKGDKIGILGKAYSTETSGERKHLHLSIHKVSAIDIRGYVQKQSELSSWIDPCSLDSVCK